MTPGANDLCVFAVKRGFLEKREIYCNPLYPFYLDLVARYKNSKYASGVIGDYVEVNPKTDCSRLTDETMVSFVPMPNVQEKNNVVTYDMVPYKEVKKGFTVFKKGDLIWAKITPCMQNGKSCIVDDMPTEIGFGSTEFHVIRKRDNRLYMPYLWAILSNEGVLKAAQATFSGSAGQQRVSANFIEEFPAVIPEYKTQYRLVSSLEKKLSRFNDKNKRADIIFADMSKMISDYLDIKEESDYKPSIFAASLRNAENSRIDPEFHNPLYMRRIKDIKRMNYKTLGDVVELSTETWNQADYFDQDFPYIEIGNVKLKENDYSVTKVSVVSAPSRARMVVRNGDIIVSTTRPHRGAVATITCKDDEIQIASTGFCVLRTLKCTDVLKEYLQWILLHDYVLLQMLQRSSGGNYPAITAEELKKIVIPIPDIEVQRQICNEANQRKEEANKMRQEAEQEWAEAKAQFEQELLGES